MHTVTLFIGIFIITMTAHTVSDQHGLAAFWHLVPFVTFVCIIKAVLGSINHKLGAKKFAAIRIFLMMYTVVVTVLILEGKPIAIAFTLPCLTASIKTAWHMINCHLWDIDH